MTGLQIGDSLVEDSDEILLELKEFYRKLYSNHDDIDFDERYLEGIAIPKVHDVDLPMLNYPITLNELEIAMYGLKLGKCPGNDGFSDRIV